MAILVVSAGRLRRGRTPQIKTAPPVAGGAALWACHAGERSGGDGTAGAGAHVCSLSLEEWAADGDAHGRWVCPEFSGAAVGEVVGTIAGAFTGTQL